MVLQEKKNIPVVVSPSRREQRIYEIAIAGHHYIEQWPFGFLLLLL
jgi:hypothetical protein